MRHPENVQGAAQMRRAPFDRVQRKHTSAHIHVRAVDHRQMDIPRTANAGLNTVMDHLLVHVACNSCTATHETRSLRQNSLHAQVRRQSFYCRRKPVHKRRTQMSDHMLAAYAASSLSTYLCMRARNPRRLMPRSGKDAANAAATVAKSEIRLSHV